MGVDVPFLRQVYDDDFRLAWYTTFVLFVASCLRVAGDLGVGSLVLHWTVLCRRRVVPP